MFPGLDLEKSASVYIYGGWQEQSILSRNEAEIPEIKNIE
jgi:hypothetical protein